MKDKEFFLICYSMESLFHQLGYPIKRRSVPKKERFHLGPLELYRNHQYYVPADQVDTKIKVTETYKGEVMTAFSKNTILTQWHPERTQDGIQCLQMWLEN
jgi:imidazoleglycerol phosphate synthase glutamine amidotransferase subunit HisH